VDRIAMQSIKRGLLSPKNFKFRRNGSKNGGFRGKWGLHVKLSVRDPSKGTSLRGTASFDVFCVKVGAGVLAVGDWKNPKKPTKNRDKGVRKIAHMCRNETPYPTCIKFCMVIGIHDGSIQTNFGYDRLRDFWVAKG